MSKVVIVTGASRGIGLAVVRQCLEKGAAVVGVSRSPLVSLPAIQHLQSKYPTFKYHSGDITDPQTADAVLNLALSSFNRLDSVVFNAGVLDPIQRLSNVDISDFKRLMDINVTSIIMLAQKCIPHLRKQQEASMVFVSSGAATNAYPGWGPYCISKAALNMLCACFGKEEPDIASVAIRPGVVDTEMQTAIRKPENAVAMGSDLHKVFVDKNEQGQLLPPEKPASVIAKLALEPCKELSGKFYSWDDPTLL
ncbi:hypothetical protein HDV05_004498 [Chytridiales sp. JEL 0842]|nr:hypothetical protein HDV05_004498 [Chytridiales sp. JEL 0842]